MKTRRGLDRKKKSFSEEEGRRTEENGVVKRTKIHAIHV